MIGVVVVTHGQLATELVNAAETIVGDLPTFTAVSDGGSAALEGRTKRKAAWIAISAATRMSSFRIAKESFVGAMGARRCRSADRNFASSHSGV